MNYYKFNIGDYAAATRHLTMLEHGAYRLLLDVYYTAEQPLPADLKATARKAGARSKEEIAAVEVVLQEFFTLTTDGWIQNRCDTEIALFQAKAETNRVVGKRGGRPKKETQTVSDGNPEITQTVSEANPHVTLNTNHKPLTTNQEERRHTVAVEEGGANQNPSVSRQTAICMVIKAEGIGAVNSQHPELLSLVEQGAEVGHFAAAAKVAKDKGKGFAYLLGVVKGQMADAAKLASPQPAQLAPGSRPASPESFKERDDRQARARWEEMTGRIHPDNLPTAPANVEFVVDVSPRFLEESST